MSSHAAAAISAMITTIQVYPQLRWPTPQPVHQSQNSDPGGVWMFFKGNTRFIGSVQILTGIGIIVAYLILWQTFVYRSIAATAVSIIGGVVYIATGCVSACAKGRNMIRAAVITNILSAVTAFTSIIVYSCSERTRTYLCVGMNSRDHGWLGVLLFLSILELFVAVLSAVYGCKALRHIGSLMSSTQQQ